MLCRLEVTPMGKPRMTRRDVWKQRDVVMRYRDYCDALRMTMPEYVLPGRLTVIFYLPMPKSWSRKAAAVRDGTPHTAKPDIDNLAKGFMDAWKQEDKHVYALNAQKYWAYEGAIEVFSEWRET